MAGKTQFRSCVYGTLIASVMVIQVARGQGLGGPSGLVVTPTAQMWSDGEIALGVDLVPDVILFRSNEIQTAGSGMIGIQFLPFLQLGLRIWRLSTARYEELQGIGDRSLVLRFKLWKESAWLPEAAIGTRDPFSAGGPHFQATYAVLSKTLPTTGLPGTTTLHMGYGLAVPSSRNYPLEGIFGGIAMAPHRTVRLVAEYDTRNVNVGLGIRPLKKMEAMVRVYDFDNLGGGVVYSFGL